MPPPRGSAHNPLPTDPLMRPPSVDSGSLVGWLRLGALEVSAGPVAVGD